MDPSASQPASPPFDPPPVRIGAIIVIALIVFAILGFIRLGRLDPRLRLVDSAGGVKALALYLGGDLSGAAKAYRSHYEQVIVHDPVVGDDPARSALMRGDVQAAEALAAEALARNPDDLSALLTLGEAALRQGAWERARLHLRRATEQYPDDFDAELLLSVAHARSGDDGAAIQALHRALRQDYRESRHTSLFQAMETAGELARRSRSERPLCLLANYYRYLRIADPAQGGQALRYARQAIARNDHPADAYLVVGVIYDKWERRRPALEAFLKAIELDPKHAEACRRAGIIYEKLGNAAQEYAMVKAAAAAAPDDRFYTGILSYVLSEKLGDYYQGLEVARRVVHQVPLDPKALWRVAADYQVLGEHERSAEWYREAFYRDPDNSVLFGGFGDDMRALGRYEDAVRAYELALERDPDSAQPHRQMAGLAHDMGNYDRAIAEYEQAIRFGDDSPSLLSSLCSLYHYHRAEYRRAADCFREVLRRDPSDTLANRLLPEVLKNLQLQTSQ